MIKKIMISIGLLIILATSVYHIFGSFKQNKKIYTIGVINYSPAANEALVGLKQGLLKLGYVEHKNIKFIYAGYIMDKDKLKKEALGLVNKKVDLIYAMSTPAALAAKKATRRTDIPVVFGPVSSPVKAGIVKSLSRPGGNVTGVTFGPQEPRRLEMLLKIIPNANNIYVPFNPDDTSPLLGIERLNSPASKLGITMHLEHVRSKEDLNTALNTFPTDIGAIFIPTDSLMVALTDLFVDFSLKNRLPLSTPHRNGVVNGALYSYGFDIRDVGIQAARLVDQIFKGTHPRDLPVELSEFVLSINIKTAKQIRVTIPKNLLRHAVIVRDFKG